MLSGFSSLITRSVRAAQNSFGMGFSARQQSYRATLKVELLNASDKKLSFLGVLAVPSDFPYQKVFSGPIFAPHVATLQQDELFGNRYAVFQSVLQPGATVTLEEKFSVEVAPFSVNLAQNNQYSFSEYVKGGGEQKGVDIQKNDGTGGEPVDVQKYLLPNPFVSCDDPRIVEMAQKIKANRDDVAAVVRDIHAFVVEFLEYGNPLLGLYTSLQALEQKTVDCGGFDTFFVALCRAVGVPARVVSGFWAGYNNNGMHAWAEFLLPTGVWVPVDPSIEQLFSQGRTKKAGKFSLVGSDRVTLSVGEHIPLLLNGKKVMVDILQNPMVYDEHGREVTDIQKNISFITETL